MKTYSVSNIRTGKDVLHDFSYVIGQRLCARWNYWVMNREYVDCSLSS